jgi:uncharacterized peroxidase-related enzyme
MAHIELEQNIPGIRSLALFRPDTGKPLYQLAQILLGEDSTLSKADRELIAAFVSSRNNCDFCMSSHAAAARYLYKTDAGIVDLALNDYKNAPISDKLRTLLSIALHVQQDARTVNNEQVALAKSFGATDRDIHDTVLIAAVFCMINRYVDGLATLTPTDPAIYAQMGERMGTLGYVIPTIKQ